MGELYYDIIIRLFKLGLKNGYGKLYLNNILLYEGQFLNDLKMGKVYYIMLKHQI